MENGLLWWHRYIMTEKDLAWSLKSLKSFYINIYFINLLKRDALHKRLWVQSNWSNSRSATENSVDVLGSTSNDNWFSI